MTYYIVTIICCLGIGFILGCWLTSLEFRDSVNEEIIAHNETKERADKLDKARCKLITDLTLKNKELEKELYSRKNQSL